MPTDIEISLKEYTKHFLMYSNDKLSPEELKKYEDVLKLFNNFVSECEQDEL